MRHDPSVWFTFRNLSLCNFLQPRFCLLLLTFRCSSALSPSYISKRNFSLELPFTDLIYGVFLRLRMPFLPYLDVDRYPQMTSVYVFVFIHRPLDSIYSYKNGLTHAIKRLLLIV
jgi:hypothetical protein